MKPTLSCRHSSVLMLSACMQGTPTPAPNKPDLTLTGHEDTAQYALSCSSAAPLVSSGGTDHNVSNCLSVASAHAEPCHRDQASDSHHIARSKS